MPLMNVDFPGNAQTMFLGLNSIFQINFVDFSTIDERLFEFPDDEPLNSNFEEFGYDSSNSIELIGNEYYFIWIIIILQMLYALVASIAMATKR